MELKLRRGGKRERDVARDIRRGAEAKNRALRRALRGTKSATRSYARYVALRHKYRGPLVKHRDFLDDVAESRGFPAEIYRSRCGRGLTGRLGKHAKWLRVTAA